MENINVDDVLNELNQYPRIKTLCEDFFGTLRLKTFLENLMNDTANGKREGFPLHVAEAIFKISEMNDMFIASEELIKHEQKEHDTAFGNSKWDLPRNF